MIEEGVNGSIQEPQENWKQLSMEFADVGLERNGNQLTRLMYVVIVTDWWYGSQLHSYKIT